MFLLIPLVIYLVILAGVIAGFISTRNKALAFILLALVAAPILPFGIRWFNSPVQLEKADIVGQYVIDSSKWPGKNAEWQHKTYTLEITETHAIVRDIRTKTAWKYGIEWSEAYGRLWNFADHTKRHHMIDNGPILYRERFGHYYAFHSPLYGNVFFKKN